MKKFVKNPLAAVNERLSQNEQFEDSLNGITLLLLIRFIPDGLPSAADPPKRDRCQFRLQYSTAQ